MNIDSLAAVCSLLSDASYRDITNSSQNTRDNIDEASPESISNYIDTAVQLISILAESVGVLREAEEGRKENAGAVEAESSEVVS